MQNKYLLAFNAHPKIGSKTLKKIIYAFDEKVELAWSASQSELEKKLEQKVVDLVIEARRDYDPDKEVEKLQKLDIGYITMYDKAYPPLLLETPDCPVVLYLKGDVSCLKLANIGVVGSRKYSNYGKVMAEKFSKDCVKSGLAVGSGLALGIDAIAHRAALDAGGITIGVLGCGLDQIYPISNVNLAREIIQNNGAIISEFPPGTPPYKQNFPLRNRIIAGLSVGVLVIEAAEKSGALITAYEAVDYNREVFVIPGDINRETSKGSNTLIQSGAKLVTCIDDILIELKMESKKSEQRAIEILPETPEETIVFDILKGGESNGDVLVEKSKLNIMVLNTTLTMMEMKGIIVNIGGGRYKLK